MNLISGNQKGSSNYLIQISESLLSQQVCVKKKPKKWKLNSIHPIKASISSLFVFFSKRTTKREKTRQPTYATMGITTRRVLFFFLSPLLEAAVELCQDDGR